MGEHWNASSLQMFCMPAECSLRKSRYLIQNAKVVLRKNKKTKNKEKKRERRFQTKDKCRLRAAGISVTSSLDISQRDCSNMRVYQPYGTSICAQFLLFQSQKIFRRNFFKANYSRGSGAKNSVSILFRHVMKDEILGVKI